MRIHEFSSFLGLEHGDTIDKAIELFGNPDDEYRNEDNHYCVMYYKYHDEDIISISYNKENNIIESIYLGQRSPSKVWDWMESHQIDDEKVSLLVKHIDEIIDIFGIPDTEETNNFIYKTGNIEIDFNCPEDNDFFCRRIFLNWFYKS